MAQQKLIFKQPQADLRRKYPRWMELSLVIALFLTSTLFYAFQRFEGNESLRRAPDDVFELTHIPPVTEQLPRPPEPQRPKIPVEANDDSEIPEDMPVDDNLFDFSSIRDVPPPQEEKEPIVPFHEVSEAPVQIKRVNPVYPDLAKRVGISGLVVVKVLINTKGDVEDVEVLKSIPMLDDAAIEAAKQFKFRPAKQRDRLVKVWMSISFNFRLK